MNNTNQLRVTVPLRDRALAPGAEGLRHPAGLDWHQERNPE
jgi:hypothetical protein